VELHVVLQGRGCRTRVQLPGLLRHMVLLLLPPLLLLVVGAATLVLPQQRVARPCCRRVNRLRHPLRRRGLRGEQAQRRGPMPAHCLLQ
jgi:hypothetical protein